RHIHVCRYLASTAFTSPYSSSTKSSKATPSPAPRPPRPPTDGNLALRKQVYASYTYDAHQAVDGSMSTETYVRGLEYQDPTSCWLSVDLGGVWDISRVLLWPSQNDYGSSFDNAEVRVGLRAITSLIDASAILDNQLVWKQDGSSGGGSTGTAWAPFIINLQQSPVKGRWVTVQNFPSYRRRCLLLTHTYIYIYIYVCVCVCTVGKSPSNSVTSMCATYT
ncbi:hypothetical protein Vretifemale_3393, partial [Volvox reticuliferus]